jgi:hypothetical protein
MFNMEKFFVGMFLLLSNYSSDLRAADHKYSFFNHLPKVESSSTSNDLNAIAKTDASSLEEFYDGIKNKQDRVLDALKVGQELFKRALILEESLKSSEYTVWWRVSDKDLARDTTSQRGMAERSFGVSLLAGYMKDGANTYGKTFFCAPNSSACVYIYYANALYAQSLLEKRQALAQDFLNFIQENEFLADNNDKILTLEEIIKNLTERKAEFEAKKEEGTLVSHIQQTSAVGEKISEIKQTYLLTERERNLLLDLILSIQQDPKYDFSYHRNKVEALYEQRINLYSGNEMEITGAALNNVYALILPKKIASTFVNGQIKFGTEAVLNGRGEEFHPRISLDAYNGLKSNIIKVYSDFTLIHEEALKQEIHKTRNPKDYSVSGMKMGKFE